MMSFLPIGARVLIAMLAIGAAAEARLLNARYSSPAVGSTLDGHNTQYVIRFDGWVDHESSRLEVIENEKLVQSLAPVLDSEPDALAASVPILPAGEAISSAGMPNPSRMAIFPTASSLLPVDAHGLPAKRSSRQVNGLSQR